MLKTITNLNSSIRIKSYTRLGNNRAVRVNANSNSVNLRMNESLEFHFSGLAFRRNQKINKAFLVIEVSGIIHNHTTFTLHGLNSSDILVGTRRILRTNLCYGVPEKLPIHRIQFDITNYLKSEAAVVSNARPLRLTANNIQEVMVTVPEHFQRRNENTSVSKERKEYFRMNVIEVRGLSDHFSYAKQDVNFAGIGYVNEYSGNLIFNSQEISTDSSRVPISFQLSHNGFNELFADSVLGNRWHHNYEYHIRLRNDLIEFTDYTNKRGFYRLLTDENVKKELGIKFNEPIFYNFYDASYLRKINDTTFELYDRNKNLMRFIVDNNSIRIEYFKTIQNNTIKATYSGNRLATLMSNDGHSVIFNYQNNRLTSVFFEKEKRTLKLGYDNSNRLNQIKLLHLRPTMNECEEEILATHEVNKATFRYDNQRRLIEVLDNKKGKGFKYNYFVANLNRFRVRQVEEFVKNSSIRGNRISYQYIGDYTVSIDQRDKRMFSYFDDLAACAYRVDDTGKTINYQFRPFSAHDNHNNGRREVATTNVQTNTRNLIYNHTFDSTGELFTDSYFGWDFIGNKNVTKVTLIPDGITGDKALQIRKLDVSLMQITQNIKPNRRGRYTISGFIKAFDDIVIEKTRIKIVVNYSKIRRVPVGNSNYSYGGTIFENRRENFSRNYIINLSNTDESWQRFKLGNINIPTDDANVILYIESNDKATFALDEIQFTKSASAVRYNYVKNGYMEHVQNNFPVNWNRINNANVMIVDDNSKGHKNILENRTLRISSQNVTQPVIRQEIKIKGEPNDKLLLNAWGKSNALRDEMFRISLTVFYTNRQTQLFHFNFDNSFIDWQVLTRSFIPELPYNKVQLDVFVNSQNPVFIDAIQLYKEDGGSTFTYDQQGNTTSLTNCDNITSNIDYDDRSRVTGVTDQTNETALVSYNADSQISKVTDERGNEVIIEYGENQHQTKMEILSPIGSIITREESSINGSIKMFQDDLLNTTTFEYDDFNRQVKMVEPNDVITKTTYDHLDRIARLVRESKDQTRVTNRYIYNDDSTIKTIIAPNSTKYDFLYDCQRRVKQVKINGNVYSTFEYDNRNSSVNKGRLIHQKSGINDNQIYKLHYNNQGQLKGISFNGLILYNYEYDELGRLIISKNLVSGEEKFYSYDFKGNIRSVVDTNNNHITYERDVIDNIQKVIYDFNSLTRTYDYKYQEEVKSFSKDTLYKRLDMSFNDDIVKGHVGKKGLYGARGNNRLTRVYDRALGFNVLRVQSTVTDTQEYDLTTVNSNRRTTLQRGNFNRQLWNNQFRNNKTVYGWFNFRNNSNHKDLLSFNQNNISRARIIVENSRTLAFTVGTQSVRYNSDITLNNRWIMLAISVKGSDYEFYVNGELKATLTADANIVTNINRLILGSNDIVIQNYYRYTPDTIKRLDLRIAFMSMGAFGYNEETIKGIYDESIEYFFNQRRVKEASSVGYVDYEAYKDFEVMSLSNTFLSSKRRRPIRSNNSDGRFHVDNSRLFNYDENLKKYVYASFAGRRILNGTNDSQLTYKLPLKTTGSISMLFKSSIESQGDSIRYILSNKDKNNVQVLGVYIDEKGYINVKSKDKTIQTQKIVILNSWHHLLVRYEEFKLDVLVDNEVILTDEISVDLTKCHTHIACDAEELLNNPINHLNGNIQMFAFTDTFISDDKANLLFENKFQINVSKTYDALGRIDEYIINTPKTSLTNKFSYRSPVNASGDVVERQTSMSVESLERFDKTKINYDYDQVGNITSVKTVNKEIKYKYDFLNRLIEEYDSKIKHTISYSYDKNGNILSKIFKDLEGNIKEEKQYIYNDNYKDLLEKIITIEQGKTTELVITNCDDFTGKPVKYGNKDLTWEGNKLNLITTPNDTIIYEYNESNVRTKKVVNDKVTKYFIEGRKILKQEDDNDILLFNYCENDSLVGFTRINKVDTSKNNEYFYIKDALGVITDIVCKAGNTVIEYEYDGWGKLLDSTKVVDKEIYELNPFIYKTYFYDKETKWYYVKSKFYDPKISRYINIGFIDELKYLSFSGLNLFSYAINNPILIDVFNEISVKENGIDIIRTALSALANVNEDISLSALRGFDLPIYKNVHQNGEYFLDKTNEGIIKGFFKWALISYVQLGIRTRRSSLNIERFVSDAVGDVLSNFFIFIVGGGIALADIGSHMRNQIKNGDPTSEIVLDAMLGTGIHGANIVTQAVISNATKKGVSIASSKVAGMKIGAKKGAMLGTMVPVVGNIIGIVVGAAIGGLTAWGLRSLRNR